MLNRLLLTTLLLALPLAASGLEVAPQKATANITTGWDPATDADVEGLPDRDDFSARFMILAGPDNSTLPGVVSGPGVTLIQLTYSPQVPTDPIRVAIFDPNTIGDWDQRADRLLLVNAPNVRYNLFADPAGDAVERLADSDNTNDPLLVVETDAYTDYNPNLSTDSAWCDFYNSTAADNAAARTPSGAYRFLLAAKLEPAPGEIFLEGPERAGHKFAFNGTYLLPAGTIVGFAGGAVDERTIIDRDDGLIIHDTQDPTTYLNASLVPQGEDPWVFNGIVDFRILGVNAWAEDLIMDEADADYQAPPDDPLVGQSKDNPLPNPTGVPPDNIPFYLLPSGPFPLRDVSAFVIESHDPLGDPIEIRWRLFPLTTQHTSPPDGDQTPPNPPFSSENDTVSGAPSIDVGQQLGPIAPFQRATFSNATLLADAGPWCIRWESVDKANFIFMKFNLDVGTTPANPTLRGRVYCDDNGNCEADQTDPGFDEEITLSLKRVDCANPDTTLATLPDIVIPANTDGSYEVTDLLPGACYRIDLVSPLDLPQLCDGQFPIDITMPSVADDLLPEEYCFKTVDIGISCGTFELCGWVFCNIDGNCTYDPVGVNADVPLLAGTTVTVKLIQLTGPGGTEIAGTEQELTVNHFDPRYCFDELRAGWYKVTTMSTTVVPSPGCETECERQVGIDIITPDCPFAFECPPACVTLFCDDNRNGLPDAGELLLDGVEVRATQGQTTLTGVTGADPDDGTGRVCFLLAEGTWTLTAIEPAGGWGSIDPTVIGPLAGASREVTVVPGLATPETYIPFDCQPGDACALLFCDDNVNGVADPGELRLSGVEVRATMGLTTLTETTGTDGKACFDDLAPGDWTLTAVEPAGGWGSIDPTVIGPLAGLSRDVTVEAGEQSPDALIQFECAPGAVCAQLFCDDNRNGVADLGELLLAGVEVRATMGLTTLTETTGSDGKACFEGMTPGDWTLTAVEPAGGWGSIDPTVIGPLAGLSRNVTVEAGEPTPDALIQFECAPGAVCAQLFCDDNRNGTPDAGELRLIGVEVRATMGLTTLTETTAANGKACFMDLTPGDWTLTAIEPVGGWGSIDPTVIGPLAGLSRSVNVKAGEPTPDALIQFNCAKGAACVVLFCDDNGNGTPDAGELRLGGVDVRATMGQTTLTETTGTDGKACFEELTPGDWTLTAVEPAGGWGSIDPTVIGPLAGLTRPVTVEAGEQSPDTYIQFECGVGSACVVLFCDDNRNGMPDPGELPLNGVDVRATMGQTTLTETTGLNGKACFLELTPGTWTLTAVEPAGGWSSVNPTVIGPLAGLTRIVEVTAGQQTPDAFIVFDCAPGEACVVLFCDDNRNNVWDADELALEGVDVRAQLGPLTFTETTNDKGRVCFGPLLPGTWTFTAIEPAGGWGTIDPSIIGPLNGLTRIVNVPAGVPVPDTPITFDCALGCLVGYVFEDPREDCDGVYASGEGLGGIEVILRDAAGVELTRTTTISVMIPGPVPREVGYYEFCELVPGVYTAEVVTPNPNVRNLTQITPAQLTRLVTPRGEARADFGYATQGLTGRVWKESDCDGPGEGTFGPDDTPLPGVQIDILGIGGDAAGYSDSQLTAADGTYSFQDIPEGRYEVTVDKGNPTVVDLVLRGDATRSVLVPICKNGLQDFWFCDTCVPKTCACIRVFMEPRDQCDGVYTEGVDTWVRDAQVFIKVKGSDGYIEYQYTDADGRACWYDLQEGVQYRLYLGANQEKAGLPKCPEVFCDFTPVCVPDSDEECCECVVGFCEPCPHQLCCEGDVREVEIETEVWCGHVDGDADVCVDLRATLYDGCDRNANVVDTVGMEFCNEFPGDKTGLDSVLTVDDVELTPWGTAIVRLKLNAAGLAAGNFGNNDYRVTVTLNGDTSTGCTKLRCEAISRGMWFTYSRLCGPKPPCDREIYDLGEWVPRDPECKARFRVLEILSYGAWTDCEGDDDGGDDDGGDDDGGDDDGGDDDGGDDDGGDDDGGDDDGGDDDGGDDDGGDDDGGDDGCEPVGPRHVELTCLVPCSYQRGMNLRHAELKLLLDGTDGVADRVELLFEGNDWTGSKTSLHDCITVHRVWKVGERDGKCIWKVKASIHRPCCISDVDSNGDGKPDLLQKARLCSTVDWVFCTTDPVLYVCGKK